MIQFKCEYGHKCICTTCIKPICKTELLMFLHYRGQFQEWSCCYGGHDFSKCVYKESKFGDGFTGCHEHKDWISSLIKK